jgi:hypothetical protein
MGPELATTLPGEYMGPELATTVPDVCVGPEQPPSAE